MKKVLKKHYSSSLDKFSPSPDLQQWSDDWVDLSAFVKRTTVA